MVDFFNKWKDGLSRTRKVTFGRIVNLLGAGEIEDDTWDEIEALMIQSDLGLETTQAVVASLRKRVQDEGLHTTDQLQDALRTELISRLDPLPELRFRDQPSIILLVGVNGSGKTTTAAKLGMQFVQNGKRVILVAADTYRAAAVDQLQVWGDRLKLPVVAGAPNADPGAVAFDGVQAGQSRNVDFVIVDTAGRLHTRFNLMEELKKVYRVVGKAQIGAPQAVWLVLDATTGQNALQQARAFKDAVKLTGVILAKLDSSAKGGMAFAIQEELKLPILYAGLGERPEDLHRFHREAFVDGILAK